MEDHGQNVAQPAPRAILICPDLPAGQFLCDNNNHTKSFRDVEYKSSTELSKYIWSLNGRPYTIKWSIAARSSPYRCGSRSCSLCLMEKLMILKDSDPDSLLNKRDELISKCRHRNKYCLKNLKTWKLTFIFVPLLNCVFFACHTIGFLQVLIKFR